MIGVEHYGAGLTALPAVRQDVSLISNALSSCGFDVERLDDLENGAEAVQDKLRDFCEESEDGDVSVIYFSGHGISVDGQDYVIPTGVSRADAVRSDKHRVSTDLGQYVADGIVIFVIDACREIPSTKGASAFDTKLGGPHYMRFLGCSQGEVCQVLEGGHEGSDVSLFSKSLAQALEEWDNSSLNEITKRATQLGDEFASSGLQPQVPHIDHGENTADVMQVLDEKIFRCRPIFDIWDRFDPMAMHCLVVTSESERRSAEDWTLERLVRQALGGRLGRQVWGAFRTYWNSRPLLDGTERSVSEKMQQVNVASLNVTDAFDDALFDTVVRALVEADLVVFDVTGFEPGVMLLMGIRSAARRGLSLCSHGGGWQELDRIDTPFNLADLSLGSHTKGVGKEATDRVVKSFVRRIERGFEQMARQPRYQDLPGHDALRQLGPAYESSSTISVSSQVLVLAAYYTADDSTPGEPPVSGSANRWNWGILRNTLEGHLDDRSSGQSRVLRLIDLDNPQLISQSLYEQIRRSAACIADWTEYSPSTFFELGVRLAVSEWGAVQLVDERYLHGGTEAERWQPMRTQIEAMRDLFKPFTYNGDGDGDVSSLELVAEELVARRPGLDRETDSGYDRVYRIVSASITTVLEANEPVHLLLKDVADALHHPRQEEKGAPQILFREGSGRGDLVKAQSKQAAREARIAAWLYLHYRLEAGRRDADAELRLLHHDLGHAAVDALLEDGELDFGMEILKLIPDLEDKE